MNYIKKFISSLECIYLFFLSLSRSRSFFSCIRTEREICKAEEETALMCVCVFSKVTISEWIDQWIISLFFFSGHDVIEYFSFRFIYLFIHQTIHLLFDRDTRDAFAHLLYTKLPPPLYLSSFTRLNDVLLKKVSFKVRYILFRWIYSSLKLSNIWMTVLIVSWCLLWPEWTIWQKRAILEIIRILQQIMMNIYHRWVITKKCFSWIQISAKNPQHHVY